MAKNLKPPEKLCLQGNLKENFRKFKQQFQIYMTASGLIDKEDVVTSSTLLHIIGTDSLEIFNTFTWEENGDDKKVDKILEKFEEYCKPRKNIVFERHLFNTRTQGDESVDVFITDLKILAKNCEFGDLKDSLITDRIVCGTNSKSVRERLLRETDLSLQKATDICRASEASKSQVKTMSAASSAESNVDAVKKKVGFKKKFRQSKQASDTWKTKESKKKSKQQCSKCGTNHEPKKCPAYGKECYRCKMRNHFSKVCYNKAVNTLEENSSDSEIYIESVDNNQTEKDWKVNVKINEKHVQLKLDTGAQCNVIPLKLYKEISKKNLKRTSAKLVSYSGHKLDSAGKATLLINTKNKYVPVEFEVVKGNTTPVLGLKTCMELKLISRVYTVNTGSENTEDILLDYDDLFHGLGCLPGEYNIQLNDNAKPVVHPPRKVPYAMRSKVKAELERMESMNVIEKVTEPTDWVNSIVVVEKPNKTVRICIDPRDLNKNIKREHYPMKTVESVAAQVKSAKVYSVLDARNGFWQKKLSKDCQNYTTFNTPFGRFKYLRLPFGISSSPEVWQRTVSQIFENVEGCEVIADDILVWGSNQQEHDKRLRNVLDIARQVNLRLNRDKCKIGKERISYVGHTFGPNGLEISQEKVRAVLEMPEPTNKTELQRFNGVVNYLGKFIPNLSSVNKPLRQLLEKDVEWHWTKTHQDSFESLKKAISTAPVLKFYNPHAEIELHADASKDGLGACIIQGGRPIAYASRALNKSEQNYAQIEKEMASIVFGATRFHEYIYGNNVTCYNDHKPLESLYKKPLSSAPPRIQRFMLKIQKYNLDVKYKPGKEMVIPDALSRAYLKDNDKSDCDMSKTVFSVENMSIRKNRLDILREETQADKVLQTLKQTVLDGWPNKDKIDPSISPYWHFKEEITFQEGLLLKSEKIIVPKSQRNHLIEQFHAAHLGINKSISRARDLFYWPGMTAQIKEKVTQCAVCNEFRNAQQKEPLKSHDVPDGPWQILATDCFEFDKEMYVVLVDYYSKYFEVSKLKGLNSNSLVTLVTSYQYSCLLMNIHRLIYTCMIL